MKSLEGVLDKLESPSEGPNGVSHMDDDHADSEAADDVIRAGRGNNGAQMSWRSAGGQFQPTLLEPVLIHLLKGAVVALTESTRLVCLIYLEMLGLNACSLASLDRIP